MSQVITIRLQDAQAERLSRLARRLGYSRGETGARLIEEALRMSEFAFIEFRDSIVGRQAYLHGSSLTVWEVVMLARERGGDPARTAAHLGWPLPRVQAALNYAEAYADEIEAALLDNASYDAATLRHLLPQTRVIELAIDGESSVGDGVTTAAR
ncbi:MAG TPA: ribbon-helix-helix protein, CopG family [Chloroflexota bacterium]|nr:ribbon-helix-helix protein, CopG family [Chloroflexota bacterium]